jgi:hypothetical protein
MSSFKYKNMQQFVKQTLYPYVVNLTLLIKDLFKRLTDLENKLATDVNTKLEGLHSQINSNDTDIANLQTQIVSNDADIINLQNQIDSNDDDIIEIQTNIEQIYGVPYTSITTSTMLLTPNELTEKIASIYGVDPDKLETSSIPTYTYKGTKKPATLGNISTDLVNHANSVATPTTASGKVGTNPHNVAYMSLVDWTYGTNPPDNKLSSAVKVYDQILSSV